LLMFLLWMNILFYGDSRAPETESRARLPVFGLPTVPCRCRRASGTFLRGLRRCSRAPAHPPGDSGSCRISGCCSGCGGDQRILASATLWSFNAPVAGACEGGGYMKKVYLLAARGAGIPGHFLLAVKAGKGGCGAGHLPEKRGCCAGCPGTRGIPYGAAEKGGAGHSAFMNGTTVCSFAGDSYRLLRDDPHLLFAGSDQMGAL